MAATDPRPADSCRCSVGDSLTCPACTAIGLEVVWPRNVSQLYEPPQV